MITGDKNCFYKSTKWQQTGLADKEALEKCRFPADSEH